MAERHPEKFRRDIAVYEVVRYYCPYKPFKLCDQTVAGGTRIEILHQKDPEYDEREEALMNARDGAPICAIHNLQMVPVISKLNKI